MNVKKLSNRLEAVAKYIPEGASIADIGSDHAYLPCNVVKRGIVKNAIAGEVAEGPFQSALDQVKTEGLTERIDVRKGDGLEVVEPGEVECVTIAGMGGALISTILEKGKSKLEGVQRLILQPNVGSFAVRRWLIENGWELVNEEILKEDGKIYEVLIADKGNPLAAYETDCLEEGILFGPFLMREMDPAFIEKWKVEIKNWQRILKQLEEAVQNEETEIRKLAIQNKIRMAEEALK